MKKQTILTGYLLILAAITFWISWFLMPDPGTTDTNHILTIVKHARVNVLSSVITQITSSVLYVFALFSLAQLGFLQKKITLLGISLFGIGVIGLGADAFFHLLAYFMTDDSVNIQQDVVRVMEFMQTTGVAFLIPLLLPFFIGSVVLAIGLKKQTMISNAATVLFIIAISVEVTGGLSAHIMQYEVHGLAFTTLGIFAAGQALIGFELISASKKKKTVHKLKEQLIAEVK